MKRASRRIRTTTRASRTKAPAARPKRVASTSGSKDLTIRTPSGEFALHPKFESGADGRELQKAAMQWIYIVRNRERWTNLQDAGKRQDDRAARLLRDLGATDAALESIARDGVAEVVIPFQSEEAGWATRILPWEYLLAGATRAARGDKALTVMRRLARSSAQSKETAPTKCLFVESAPGELRGVYTFDTERALVRKKLRVSEANWFELSTPTVDQLERTIAQQQPDIIHVTGFDSHQGLQEMGRGASPDPDAPDDEDSPARVLDGYLLVDSKGRPAPVGAERLARVLCGGVKKPTLVSFGIWNSAARIAPLVVAAGAGAAIGFQDVFDDARAEMFFGSFYRAWRKSRWRLAEAFRSAWESVRAQGVMRGSGLVLWGSRPLITAARGVAATERARKRPTEREEIPVWPPGTIPAAQAHEVIRMEIEPLPELNYSLLHNRRPLFKTFTLINDSDSYQGKDQMAVLQGVEVSVRLSAGPETASYDALVDVKDESLSMLDEIRVPLTSTLMRSAHESINSSIFTEVAWGGRTLHRDSRVVRLLPVDQWRDNDKDGMWLPSFVLPRDPQVSALIAKAGGYVRVLRDDPTAGFDGYQSIDDNATDPTLDVDRQAQAIWSAIVYEWSLGYINPPPAYNGEMDSQRLRTPSGIARDRSGTCIDLALLFAACLELVDIYPVIFLLKAHAFPGYWRRESHRDGFIEIAENIAEEVTTESADKTSVPGAQRVPWWFRKSAFEEIVKQVKLGHLVPLESVWLTERSGFWDAVDGGIENLKSKREFHSMLDIARAREELVTPLPIWGEP